METDNQIRKFQCSKCNKPKFILKKVADKQHHGFSCDECWTTIEKKNQCARCIIS